jgi:hypothetical protein
MFKPGEKAVSKPERHTEIRDDREAILAGNRSMSNAAKRVLVGEQDQEPLTAGARPEGQTSGRSW